MRFMNKAKQIEGIAPAAVVVEEVVEEVVTKKPAKKPAKKTN